VLRVGRQSRRAKAFASAIGRVECVAQVLEARRLLAAPATPVIIEPFIDGQVTGTFDINLQTAPEQYSDPDGNAWQATEWRIREQSSGTIVWQTGFLASPPLTLYRVDFSDGTFVNTLAGKTELNFSTNYQLLVHYRDANSEVSADAIRNFTTTGPSQVVPGAGMWLVRPGYVVEPVQSGLRLPVNLAFVPNPGPNPTDPLYYVAELYGSIQVVRNDGTRQTFATGLLDYNPQGPISGSGEQGLTGLAVERDAGNPAIYNLYVGMLWDNGSPAGAPNHYPKVERLTSAAGGLALASRTVLLNMQPETQGQSHQISNITLGPDNKLYVHMGDGFDASTALNLNSYRGKVLRMNKNGTPVATGDPAGANPFYNVGDGINARDYIYTYGHRNPFGGAWRADGKHWVVENGNSLDRMVDLISGQSYGWAGSDSTLIQFSKYIWNPATAPVNIDFVEATKFGGSGFPADVQSHAFVTLSGSTYAAGPQQRAKGIVDFPDLTTLGPDGKLLVQPSFFVKYNGTGRASVSGVAAGPDGLYFTDLYEDTGAGGATGPGANVYRVRYVGSSGGDVPSIATPAAATPNPIVLGNTAQLNVIGADDGGEANLNYTWIVLGNPPAPVAFSSNGTNAAKNTTAIFTANGAYNVAAVIRDAGGQTVTSNVIVNIGSVLTDTGIGLSGQYFNNIDFTGATFTRIDPNINFNFGADGPGNGFGADTFSIRWTGFIVPRYTQSYTFYTTTDDGVRLWVNNLTTPIINQFVDQGTTTWTGTISLVANTVYPIRMDFYENAGGARAQLEWSSGSQLREIIPQGRLFTAVPTLPSAPTNLQLAAPLSTRVDLSWLDNAGNEAGFKIQRSLDGTSFANIATLPAGATSFVDTTVAAATQYFYRVRSTNPAGDSGFVANSITTPTVPVVTGAQLNINGPTVAFTFSEPIAPASVIGGDLQISNLTTGAPALAAINATVSPDGLTLTFGLPTNLADGNYRLRIPAAAVASTTGQPTTAAADLTGATAFFLAGDATRDRQVNLDDFTALASSFGLVNRVFSQGDFNYDAQVTLDDFTILAAQFGKTLAAPSDLPRAFTRSPIPTATPQADSPKFSTMRIIDEVL